MKDWKHFVPVAMCVVTGTTWVVPGAKAIVTDLMMVIPVSPSLTKKAPYNFRVLA